MNHTERAHAIISPSFLHIGLNCSGSIMLKEKIPTPPTNIAAAKGTKIHEAAEGLLNAHLRYAVSGEPIPELVCEESILEVATGWKHTVWKEVFNETITGKAWGVEEKLIFSEKFSIFGTADLWVISTDERAKRFAHIADLKTGHVYVDVKNNPQLIAYALALRNMLRGFGKDLDYVITSVYQPFSEGEKWRSHKYTSKQLDAWEKKILKLAETVFSNKAKFKAGAHCKYCPCQAHCEVYGKSLSKETSLALINPSEIKFPDVALISDEALVKITLNAKALDTFVKACKKRVMEKLYNGEKLPGIKAVEGVGKRKIDETKADIIEEAAKKHHFEPYTKKLKGIGELEKEFSKLMKPKDAKALVDSFTVRNGNPIFLVPEDDERPALTSKIELLNDIEIEG